MTNFKKTQNYLLAFSILIMLLSACQQKAPSKRQGEWLNTMEQAAITARIANDQRLNLLKREVKNQSDSSEGVVRIKRVEALKKRTANLMNQLNELKSMIVKEAGEGLDAKTLLPKKPQNVSGVKKVMDAQIDKLTKTLDEYVNYLSTEFKDMDLPEFERLTEGRKYPKEMSFRDIFYKNANVLEALCSLTTHQLVLLRYEGAIMKRFGS